MAELVPDFSRFEAAVTREHLPDRLPNSELEVDVEIMEEFMGHRIRNVQDHADFWREAGYDYTVLYILGQPIPDHFYQDIIGEETPGHNEGSGSASTFTVAGVKDEQSFEAYPWHGPEDIYYRDVDMIAQCLPEGMKLVISQGPLFSGLWRLMGLQEFSIACLENPDLIKQICEKLGELSVDIIENVVQRDWVGAVWFGDDLAYTESLMVAPEFLRTHVFPYYKRIGDLCREYNKLFILHSDGDLTEVYADLLACGVQAIHPNEPTSVDILELKRQYGDRVSFIGNIDIGLLTRGTVDDVVQASKYLIENVAPGGGFALGSGNSIASYIPLQNYRAMLETVQRYGKIY